MASNESQYSSFPVVQARLREHVKMLRAKREAFELARANAKTLTEILVTATETELRIDAERTIWNWAYTAIQETCDRGTCFPSSALAKLHSHVDMHLIKIKSLKHVGYAETITAFEAAWRTVQDTWHTIFIRHPTVNRAASETARDVKRE